MTNVVEVTKFFPRLKLTPVYFTDKAISGTPENGSFLILEYLFEISKAERKNVLKFWTNVLKNNWKCKVNLQ